MLRSDTRERLGRPEEAAADIDVWEQSQLQTADFWCCSSNRGKSNQADIWTDPGDERTCCVGWLVFVVHLVLIISSQLIPFNNGGNDMALSSTHPAMRKTMPYHSCT